MATKSKAVKTAAKQKADAAGPKAAAPAKRSKEDAALIEKLQERALLVRLATGRWYGRGTDSNVVSDVREKAKATGDVGTFTKRLMERQHLASIDAVVNDARRYHKEMTLAWGSEFRILSSDLFLDYRATMSDYQSKFEKEVREFLSKFDKLRDAEKIRLGGLYREEDYPSHDGLKSRFYMQTRFESVPDADDFRVRLGGEDIALVKKQIQEQVMEGLQEATVEIWTRVHDLVKKLRDVLKKSDAGVRVALFDNLKEIVTIMPRLNLMGDKHIGEITARITKELLAEDVGAVKDDDHLRAALAKKADSILEAMSEFVAFDDEEKK